nr:prostaglandin E synthase 2 [Ipomoea batatas]
MRRLSGFAAIFQAAKGLGAVPARTAEYRMLQSALYSTGNNSSVMSHVLSHTKHEDQSSRAAARVVSGTMLFSVAASTLAEEAHAKEPIPPKFRPNDVVLYQYEACPFCNKVKAFLDYYGIPYKIVEVNPISKNEIKWSDYRKVPILMVDGEQMVDSSDIIDKLFQKVCPQVAAKSTSDNDEENKWRKWVDNHLVHILSPNIYRSASEALESFDYITTQGNFSFYERTVAKYAGATAMYFVSKKLKKKYNITDERAALYEAAETWVDALNGRDFLGGSKPNLADLAVFGVLRPIRNLKSGKDMVENTRIGDWYSRMEGAVGQPSKVQA